MLFCLSYILFINFVSISTLHAKLPWFSVKTSSIIEDFSQKIGDAAVEKIGFLSLSQENEELVRSVINKAGIKRKVVIRRLSNLMIQKGAGKNAFTMDLGSIVYMFFDEDYFDLLSEEEKKFIAAHEVSHANRLHIPLINAAILTIVPMLVKLSNKYIFKGVLDRSVQPVGYYLKNELSPELSVPTSILTEAIKIPLSAILTIFFTSKFFKLAEYDADLSAVRILECTNGGKKFWIRKINERDPESYYRFTRICDRFVMLFRSFFQTHPSDEERLDLLKKIDGEVDISLHEVLIDFYVEKIKNLYVNFSHNVKVALS